MFTFNCKSEFTWTCSLIFRTIEKSKSRDLTQPESDKKKGIETNQKKLWSSDWVRKSSDEVQEVEILKNLGKITTE